MKKLMVILLGVALVGFCSSASAATVLPDEVLGELYASGTYNNDINYFDGTKSAAAEQSNIGAIVAAGAINSSSITQGNCAFVMNLKGSSAVALQSNIAAIVGTGTGNTNSANIDQENFAIVTNMCYRKDWDEDEDLTAGSVGGDDIFGSPSDRVLTDINRVLPDNSAVALQSNIGAIVNLGGGVSNSQIAQKNCAFVSNIPGHHHGHQ